MRRSQGNRCGIVPCLAILITILTTPAQAYESEWSDYAKALDALAKVAGDYEAMLRYMRRHGISTNHIPKIMVRMATGGNSALSPGNVLKVGAEIMRSWRANGLKTGYLAPFLKPVRKLGQYRSRP